MSIASELQYFKRCQTHTSFVLLSLPVHRRAMKQVQAAFHGADAPTAAAYFISAPPRLPTCQTAEMPTPLSDVSLGMQMHSTAFSVNSQSCTGYKVTSGHCSSVQQ